VPGYLVKSAELLRKQLVVRILQVITGGRTSAIPFLFTDLQKASHAKPEERPTLCRSRMKLRQRFPGDGSMRSSSNISVAQDRATAILCRPPLNLETAERQLWKVVCVNRHYQQVENACYLLLAFSVICAVLYSLSVFLG
jgi:hypothetical protein